MISPSEFDDLTFRIVGGAEQEYCAAILRRLTTSLVSGGSLTAKDYYDIEMLARANHEALTDLTIRYRNRITADTRKAVEDALRDSAANDLVGLKTLYPSVAPIVSTKLFHQVSAQTVQGVQSIIARQNVSLVANAEKLWYEVAGEAVAAWNQGLMPMDKILSQSVSRLADGGLSVIDYKSGQKTSLEAAVRRHAVSQIGQASGRITMGYMEEFGHDLVMTSAHFGARPEHEVWQGKAFSLSGRKVVDGVTYPDFYKATEYGDVAGLLGVNCRHSYGPYYPGISELPKVEKERDGKTSAEQYELSQKQRYYERNIRKKKREIALGDESGISTAQKRLELGRQQQKLRELCETNNLVRNPLREKAYAIGKQPRALRSLSVAKTKPSRPTIPISQSDIDRLVKNELSGIEFTGHPVYNPRISNPGVTRFGGSTGYLYVKKTEIGKQYYPGDRELVDTLIHEEMEARIWTRDKPLYARLRKTADDRVLVDERHLYIDQVISRYAKLRGWK
jgi:hypothetical protein